MKILFKINVARDKRFNWSTGTVGKYYVHSNSDYLLNWKYGTRKYAKKIEHNLNLLFSVLF